MTLDEAVLTLASTRLRDAGRASYTAADLIAWANHAIRAICLMRPDAHVTTGVRTLVAGVRQTLDSTAREHRLMALLLNVNADGTTYENAIRGPSPREDLDAVDPTWVTGTVGTEILDYVYSELIPMEFWVYPGVANGRKVLASVATVPAELTATDDTWPLNEKYAAVAVELVLHEAFGADDENNPNYERAQRAWGKAMEMLTAKGQADVASSPRVVERQR